MKPGRLEALKSQHIELAQQVSLLATRPFSDPVALTELKRRKLLIKDQLAAASVRPTSLR
jgi:hypothetical protein